MIKVAMAGWTRFCQDHVPLECRSDKAGSNLEVASGFVRRLSDQTGLPSSKELVLSRTLGGGYALTFPSPSHRKKNNNYKSNSTSRSRLLPVESPDISVKSQCHFNTSSLKRVTSSHHNITSPFQNSSARLASADYHLISVDPSIFFF